MASRRLFLLSSSNVHGYGYLEHAKPDLLKFLSANNVSKILFVPYALHDHKGYVTKVSEVLISWGIQVEGIHTATKPVNAVNEAQAIFIGGGNTFRLLKTLYELELLEPIRNRVLNQGVPYIGSSAGTNVATRSIHTTNDMPIVFPPSFEALSLVPFNINPHYLDPEQTQKHKGETREERIKDFHDDNDHIVIGLREGTALLINGNKITLIGSFAARVFRKGEEPVEFAPESDLSFLMK